MDVVDTIDAQQRQRDAFAATNAEPLNIAEQQSAVDEVWLFLLLLLLSIECAQSVERRVARAQLVCHEHSNHVVDALQRIEAPAHDSTIRQTNTHRDLFCVEKNQ